MSDKNTALKSSMEKIKMQKKIATVCVFTFMSALCAVTTTDIVCAAELASQSAASIPIDNYH